MSKFKEHDEQRVKIEELKNINEEYKHDIVAAEEQNDQKIQTLQ